MIPFFVSFFRSCFLSAFRAVSVVLTLVRSLLFCNLCFLSLFVSFSLDVFQLGFLYFVRLLLLSGHRNNSKQGMPLNSVVMVCKAPGLSFQRLETAAYTISCRFSAQDLAKGPSAIQKNVLDPQNLSTFNHNAGPLSEPQENSSCNMMVAQKQTKTSDSMLLNSRHRKEPRWLFV